MKRSFSPSLASLSESGTLPPKAGSFIRILLVEDSDTDVLLFEHMLLEAKPLFSYEIASAPRLTEAFELIANQFFDLIMLDLNLLDINGIMPVAALSAEAPDVPIVVYSGMMDARLKEKALNSGARHYLVKGRESADSLVTLIEAILAER